VVSFDLGASTRTGGAPSTSSIDTGAVRSNAERGVNVHALFRCDRCIGDASDHLVWRTGELRGRSIWERVFYWYIVV